MSLTVKRLSRSKVLIEQLNELWNTGRDLGGYSDISNRGTLDRLLLTELAHDNDTLAVRISNSEALYLRREVPPSKESLDRCLLIESTIRSWGTPRVYQAAVAIALTASAPDDSRVFAWRCSDTLFERSYFTDQSGLEEHMQALDSSLHHGGILRSLYLEMNRTSKVHSSSSSKTAIPDTSQANCLEVFLIMSRETWVDRGFRDSLLKSGFQKGTIAIIDRYGELELLSYSANGTQLLKRIELKLASPPKREGLASDSNDETSTDSLFRNQLLPKIFQADPFPIRLSVSCQKPFLVDRNLLVSKLKGGGLYLWDSWSTGAVTLRACELEGPLVWAGYDAGRSRLVVVVGNVSNRKTTVLSYDIGSYALLNQFEMEPCDLSDQFTVDEGALLIVRAARNELEAWSLAEGLRLASIKIGELGVANTFRGQYGQWIAAHFNGLGFDALPVSFGMKHESKDLLLAMVAPAKDGYIGVTREAKFVHSNGTCEPMESCLTAPLTKEDLIVVGGNRWICSSKNAVQYAVEITDQGKAIPIRLISQIGSQQMIQELAYHAGNNPIVGTDRIEREVLDPLLTLFEGNTP